MIYFLGARPYDFTDEDGRKVTGVTAWFCDDEQKGAVGYTPFKASYSRERFAQIFGGENNVLAMALEPVQVDFNRYGKPDRVTVLEEAPTE